MSFTARGWAVLGGGVAWCAVALAIGQRDLWWPGLFLILLPVASRLLAAPGTGRMSVLRRLEPDRVAVGEPVQVRLTLATGGVRLGGIIHLRDRLPPGLGESRWFAITAGAGRRPGEHRYEVRPAWRGRYRIGPLDRAITDGLGLVRANSVIAGHEDLLVTPRVEPLTNLGDASGVGLATDTTFLRTGLGSTDDVLIREYRHGDDVRRVHWRSSAHAGELMVRREERSWNPSATVVIDNRARGYSTRVHDERLEWGVSAAASIGLHLLGDGFDLSIVDANAGVLSPRRSGPGREAMVLEHLAELVPDRAHTLGAALAACNAGTAGQLLVAILSRVDEEDLAALTEAGRHGRACWALLLASSAQLDAGQAAAIQAAGWRCVVSGPGNPVADAWRRFGQEPR